MEAIVHTIVFVQAYHATDRSGHGVDHIMRVYRNAQKLISACDEPVNQEVLLLAALLHDVDDPKINPEGHIAEKYLKELGLAADIRQQVLNTIAPISFSVSGVNPSFNTIEQRLLSDADKLDAVGAIGICRTIAYGSSKGRPLFDVENDLHTVGHFFDKLLLLRNAMQTEVGKQEAQHRHQVMVMWLSELFREIEAPAEWVDRLNQYRN